MSTSDNGVLAETSESRRYRRTDTIDDAKFLDLSLATPLVFAAQTSEDLGFAKDDEYGDGASESRTEFPGPQKWEEGYQHELKGEASRILRTFAKTPADNDHSLPPMAAVLDDNLSDRLGLGYLDPSSLTLVSDDSSNLQAIPTMRRSLGAGQFTRMTSRINFHSRTATRTREERRRQELRDRVLPSSTNFTPEFYLSHVHADSSLDDLQEGMHFLEEELSKRTGQLKTLVKEHFEGFISCKNTIDDVHIRLKRNEAQNSGANTHSLKASLARVQSELLQTFSPILARHDKVEQLKHIMEILKRFQSSFNLPSNIRQLSENQDYRQVVTEYSRAKSIMAASETVIWQSLFEEVKKEATDVCMKINKTLADPMLDSEEVEELVFCIAQLRKEGLEFSITMEPALQWLLSVEEYIHQEMDKHTTKYRHQVEVTTQLQAKTAKRRTIQSPFAQGPPTKAPPINDISIAKQSAEYMTKLCRLLVAHLPKLWKLKRSPQLHRLADVSSDIQTSIVKELSHVDVATQGILNCFTKHMAATMEAMLVTDGLLSCYTFAVLKELRIFAADMKECPESCLRPLTGLMNECYEMCVNYLCTFLRQQMASLGEWEDWKIRIGSTYRDGHPVTSIPYKLGQAVRDVMEQFAQIKAEQDQWLDGSIRIEAKSLNTAFNECFESFAMAVEGLAAEILSPNEPTPPQHNPQIPEISKLLILISNSIYIRKRVLPELKSQYSEFIEQEPFGTDGDADPLLSQFNRLEATMIQAYIDQAKRTVEKVMDMTIATEKETPPTRCIDYSPTDQPGQWIAAIADFHAELLKYAPSQIDAVIRAMVLHLIKRLKLRIQDLPNLSYLLQMYIDAMFVESVFRGIDYKEMHRAWKAVYERLNNLIRAQLRAIKETDDVASDTGINVGNVFSEEDIEDISKLDKKLQKMFKESVRESIKDMSMNLVSMRLYKSKEKDKPSLASIHHQHKSHRQS